MRDLRVTFEVKTPYPLLQFAIGVADTSVLTQVLDP